MDTLRYLIHKRIAKRSPRNTREGVIGSFFHVEPKTVVIEIWRMLNEGELKFVNNGGIMILRSSTDIRESEPETFARIQRELDRENE